MIAMHAAKTGKVSASRVWRIALLFIIGTYILIGCHGQTPRSDAYAQCFVQIAGRLLQFGLHQLVKIQIQPFDSIL